MFVSNNFVSEGNSPVAVRDRKGTPKTFCNKDCAELPGEVSGAICLKTLVLLGSALELFRKFFGAVCAIYWLWGSSLAPETVTLCLERSFGKGMRRSRTQWREAPFHWMGSRHSVNEGTGKELGKAIQWRGLGHSANRRTLKIKIFCAHPLPKSPLLSAVFWGGGYMREIGTSWWLQKVVFYWNL